MNSSKVVQIEMPAFLSICWVLLTKGRIISSAIGVFRKEVKKKLSNNRIKLVKITNSTLEGIIGGKVIEQKVAMILHAATLQ